MEQYQYHVARIMKYLSERKECASSRACQICVNDSMSVGNGLFVPYLLICTVGSGNDGIGFFLAALCLALNLGDRGDIISRSTSHIGMGHIFLCHSNHLRVSIPHWSQTIPNVGYMDMDSQRNCTLSEIVVTAINRAITQDRFPVELRPGFCYT